MSATTDTEQAAWTIGRLLSWTTGHLGEHGVEEPRLSAEVLLAHAADCRRIDLYTRMETVLPDGSLVRFREFVRRAAAREPVAYLVGEKEFFSLAFRVTPEVLIPRPETELLVSCILDHCAAKGWSSAAILDLGTGSGCIAITLLNQLPGARAVATDVSSAALAVAESNAERHGVLERLTLVEADRLALPDEAMVGGGFDVLASNPPYVAADAMTGLDVSVRDFEPSMALTDGEDGLSFYRSIGSEGIGLLAPHGVVFVEVGDDRAGEVVGTVEGFGKLIHRRTWKDSIVGQGRVLMFSRKDAP